MSPGHPPVPAAEDTLASVRRLLREAPPGAAPLADRPSGTGAPDPADGRLVLTQAHRVDEVPVETPPGAAPAPLLVLSEVLRAAPPEVLQGQPRPPAEPLDEAAVRRIVAEALREALGAAAIRDLVRREVLQMLDRRDG